MKAEILRPTWIIFFACALHWIWGCSLIFSHETSRIAAWESFSYMSNLLLGATFIIVATLGYLSVFKQRSTWLLVPQQIMLMLTAASQARLITQGHYADWVIRPMFFIFRDQVWGILLAGFHLIAMLWIVYSHKTMFKIQNFCKPIFEAGLAGYAILNALFTFNPDSAVLSNLWQLIGGYSILAVCYQIFAAGSVLYGIAYNRINVRIMGLIMLCSVFAIRAVVLLTDNDIVVADLNTTALAVTLIGCSVVRILDITKHLCSSSPTK